MNVNWKIVSVALVATVVGFMLEGPGPVGKMLWPMPEGMAQPEGANMALLMVMGGLEAIAFGIGVAFLVFGLPWARAATATPGQAAGVYVSIAWLLVNWVPHTALHMSLGNIMQPSDYTGLVAIEYGFHLTLMVAGVVLLMNLVRGGRARAAASTRTATSA